MESVNNSENVQPIKDAFKEWLKKLHESVSIKNQSLKTCLSAKQQTNSELYVKIEKHTNNLLGKPTLAIDVIPNKVQSQLEVDVNHLRTKSEQLSKCYETINAKVEEETKKVRNQFYEIITKDDLTLKPYYEVEEAIEVLNKKIDQCKRQQEEDKEHFFKIIKEKELYYNEIKQNIVMLEPIEQELRLLIQNCERNLREKLKSLNLSCIEEANDESNESKQLLDDISNIKSQLNIK